MSYERERSSGTDGNNRMKSSTVLAWDSRFFGFDVARIHPERLKKMELSDILTRLQAEGVSLVYWSPLCGDSTSESAARANGGFLADTKTTYWLNLEKPAPKMATTSSNVEEYKERICTEQLERLALWSGVYSRFKVDPMIPGEKFESLYRQWIRKSVAGSMADAVFVLEETDGTLVGFLTVIVKDHVGSTGLVAVDANSTGKKYGSALIDAAHTYFLSRGCTHSRVVTQAANISACRLYEKFGYKVRECRNFFHFWLNP